MVKGKLILICQSGGELVKNDDGTLTYAGGEAQAVNVNSETVFNDLKLKLAEMCNLDYETVSIKYFLPGNTRTVITLANDKDLRRMLDFHGNSVTAEVFVKGKEGFNRDALNKYNSRETGIKVAESVSRVVAPSTAAATSLPPDAASPDGTPTSRFANRRTSAGKKASPAAAKTASPAAANKASPAAAKKATAAASNKASPAAAKKATAVASKKATPAAPKNQSTPSPKNRSTAAPKKATPARVANRRTAAPKKATTVATDSATGVDDANSRSPTRSDTSSNDSVDANSDDSSGDWPSAVAFSAKGSANSSMEIDKSVSPADTVKKRRRTASWKIGANGPTIVSVPDDEGDERSRKARRTRSDDMSLEKLIESWKVGITGFGQDFKNVYVFRDALQKFAIAHHFVYRLKKNDSSCVSARCVTEGCSWRIHAAWVPSAHSFRVKKFDNSHTCNGESWKSAHPAKNCLQTNAKPPFHGDGKGALRGYFIAAAHAVRLVGFKKFTEQIKHVSSQAYDWVMQIEPEYWTTTSFKGERHNQITENVAEPYIKLMEQSQELPITQKIDALISMMTDLINARQTDSSKWSTKLTPSKMGKLQEEAVDSRGLKVFISSDTIFEVRDDVSHVVNLNNSDCTCLVWRTTGLPCRHAIAVCNYMHKNVYNYCSSYFMVDTFRLTYSESINPVPGFDKVSEKEEDVSDAGTVLPPCPSLDHQVAGNKTSRKKGTK
ncbi:hypothetical protein Vadar_005234 [Vaccinium darrowii]|uniref:Uncharacterized protein n=1 Tax=Vaccinium darrowii TaxID=229202 RepID=A0ACB7YLF2_9ERIC|nr:hypothetical protein Vadar_005234 [Vaccinium darrowii]